MKPVPALGPYRNILVLAVGHACLISMFSSLVPYSAIVGESLTGRPELATLPFGVLALTQMILSFWVSKWMYRVGRRYGFLFGASLGIIGGILVSAALLHSLFGLLLVGYSLLGAAAAFAIFYRFAAVEGTPERLHNRAVSWVLAGGVIAALIGPQLANQGRFLFAEEFAGSAMMLIAVWAFALLLMCFLKSETPAGKRSDRQDSRAKLAGGKLSGDKLSGKASGDKKKLPLFSQSVPKRTFFLAAIFSAVAYGIMNLLMLATPLAMRDIGIEFPAIARTIQLHVLAMYLPSFFTGSLIDRFGVHKVLAAGVAVLMISSGIHFAMAIPDTVRFMLALIALGVGWNFLFVGASTIVAKLGTGEIRARIQGINEVVILSALVLSSFTSGTLFNLLGWYQLNLLALPILVALGVSIALLGQIPSAPSPTAPQGETDAPQGAQSPQQAQSA